MNILLTNDDGYQAKGIQVLAEMMKNFGDVYVIAPKTHQSGMSMAVSLGFKAIRYKELLSGPGLTVAYLDATPASCVKYALDSEVSGWPRPDVVVSGINHGSNAASASCYSGTLGAAQEAALCGIPAIGVSLNSMNPDADFTAVVRYFPDIFRKLIEADTGNGNTKDGQDSRYQDPRHKDRLPGQGALDQGIYRMGPVFLQQVRDNTGNARAGIVTGLRGRGKALYDGRNIHR